MREQVEEVEHAERPGDCWERERERMRGKGRSTVFSEVGIYINIYIKERL